MVDCFWSVASHIEKWRKNPKWLNNIWYYEKLIFFMDDKNRLLMNSSINLIDKILLHGNEETIHIFLSSEDFLAYIETLIKE